MVHTDRRGEAIAIFGALVSLAAAVLLGVMAIWCRSSSVWAASFQLAGATAIWVLSLIQLHQHRLVAEERLEVAEMERVRAEKLGGAQTIFDEEDIGQMEKLAMGRRLRWIERIIAPVFALFIAAFNIVAGLAVLPSQHQFPPIQDALAGPVEHANILLFFTIGIAFVCFMLSRYALAMARSGDWYLLRAGGDFAFGSSAVCLAISIALLFVISGQNWAEVWLGRAIGILLILTAIETIINFILDFYRPRTATPGQPGAMLDRPFYDSRLLGMFSEPGGILRSVANALDYQFGFKVSQTWFYQLLKRQIPQLVLVQLIALMLLTCVSVVPPGHQGVVEHFGQLQQHTAKPGIHFTFPWPIDRVTTLPVERVQHLAIGYELDPDSKKAAGPILWTRKHYLKEYQLLVADKAASANSKTPINLVTINMPVQWRIKDADDEVKRCYSQTTYDDLDDLIHSLAFRELTQYAASADILDLLGKGGIEAAAQLHKSIQDACDHAGLDGNGLGVQIVHVGIGGLHPPTDEEVAATYEAVVSAYEMRDGRIKEAEGDAASIRMGAAGTEWETLYKAIKAEDEALNQKSPDLAKKSADVEHLLRDVVGGSARQMAAGAEALAWTRVFTIRSDLERQTMQLQAYTASPRTFMLRSYLSMLDEAMQGIRKYVVVLKDSSKLIYEVDLKPPQSVDILGAERAAGEAKKMQEK